MTPAKVRSPMAILVLAVGFAILSLPYHPALGDSVFSIDSIGNPLLRGSARARGMGGVGIALLDTERGSLLNTALNVHIPYVSLTGVYEGTSTRSWVEGEGETFSASEFPEALGVIPFPWRFTLSAGYSTTRSGQAKAVRYVDIGDSVSYKETLDHSQTIRAVPISICIPITGHVSVAGGPTFQYVSRSDNWTREFEVAGYTSSLYRLASSFTGVSAHGALLLRLTREIAVGAFYTSGTTLHGENRMETPEGTSTDASPQMEFPATGGFGFSWRPASSLLVAADLVWEGWKDFRIDGTTPFLADDVLSGSAGLELSIQRGPDPSRRWPPLRLGYHWDEGLGRDPLGNRLREDIFTAGTDLILGAGRAYIDLSGQIGWRGDRSGDNPRERFLRFTLSFTGTEIWSRPKKDEEDIDEEGL